MPAKEVAAWQCEECKELFAHDADDLEHLCKSAITKVYVKATDFCKTFSHDWRVESWEVVRTEEWEEPDHSNVFGPGTGLVTNFSPVYKIKALCERCGETTYTEKICYNQQEIPKKGVEVRIEAA